MISGARMQRRRGPRQSAGVAFSRQSSALQGKRGWTRPPCAPWPGKRSARAFPASCGAFAGAVVRCTKRS